ncbi:unnamed protein product, partial [Cladocopium goreaui]
YDTLKLQRSAMGNASQRPEGDDKAAVLEKANTEGAKPEKSREDIRDKYELGKVLGSGSFGQVREASLKEFPDKVRAVKIIERDDDAEHGGEWSNSAMFRQEVALLQNLKHDNIVRFWDVYEDVHFLYVVPGLEAMEDKPTSWTFAVEGKSSRIFGGQLEVFLGKILELRRFTEANAATLGSQMLAENFLLSDKSPTSVVKMIDFGMAVKYDHGVWFKEICGSPHYLAPELIGQKYNHMVDMWAFGVLMYLLMYGHYPYDSKNTRDIMMKVLTEPIRWQTKAKLSQQTLGFLKRCLEPSVRKRITAEDGLKHPWIVTAAAPDPETGREKTIEVEEEMEAECNAHRKVTATRKQVDQEATVHAENRRTDLLEKINKDFEKGIRLGNRLGETPQEDFMSKPEFVRRDNRLTTAPSQAVGSGPSASKAVVEEKKVEGKKVVIAEETKREELAPANRRKKAHAQTARLMYMGDLQEKDEDEMRKMWSEWKTKEKDEAGMSSMSPTAEVSEDRQDTRNNLTDAAGIQKLRSEKAQKEAEEEAGFISARGPIGVAQRSAHFDNSPEVPKTKDAAPWRRKTIDSQGSCLVARSNCRAQCLEERLDLDWEEIPEEIQLKSEKDSSLKLLRGANKKVLGEDFRLLSRAVRFKFRPEKTWVCSLRHRGAEIITGVGASSSQIFMDDEYDEYDDSDTGSQRVPAGSRGSRAGRGSSG